MSSFNGPENVGVYELITELCTKTASKCMQSKISQKQLAAKMRSHAYEIMLRKSMTEIPCSSGDPIKDLLSYHFESQKNVKNVAEYKRTVDLKNAITHIRTTDFGDGKDCVYNTLRLLIGLRNSVKDDLSEHLFQNPFSFGLLDEMLPKPNREPFGSPQPYPYFPSYMFDLPYRLKAQGAILDSQKSQSYTEYTVETFDSRSFLPENYSQHGSVGTKTFLSPMTLASMTSTCISPYSESTLLDYPRLTGPRDLKIPSTLSAEPNFKISLASTNVKLNVDEVYRAKIEECVDIWELATQVDKDVPLDIWEEVSKLPPINERQIIATSTRELGLWRGIYNGMSDLNVISEKQFIRHIMYLIIGVETSSFLFNQESNCFYMKENLILEGISRERIKGYASTLLAVGTYYRRLYNFAFNQNLEDHFHTKGLIYEAAREEVRRYLLKFRLLATEIYEDFCKHISEDINCMPTLLQILYHLEPLKYEIETIASIYKMMNTDPKATLPYGAELMSYFFNEISLITHKRTAQILFNSLFSVCKVYFKFIERFIFEGELDDRCHEFFIRKDIQYVNSRTKRYWDKGFHITLTVAVPEFLRPIASFILLCGKSLRLLKLCNPNDPLVVLISSDHPSVRCCASFEELERQQRVLDVYRTRCLFVSGEPVTFEQILLKREAERKAFAEMASLKQAETMEKIVAERKRLAQLIIAEKQHSLRVLEAAIAEAKAAKREAKQREKKRYALEKALERATEEVDSKLKDVERDKMMEYYSKLNMAVEKSKIHTEWKIKRLQLDQSRMQLLSTEERNLKREKLELEHQRNEAVMQMSIQSVQSIDTKSDDDIFDDNDNGNNDNTPITSTNMTDLTLSIEIKENPQKRDVTTNKAKAESSSDVFSAICNVAKSIFGVSKTKEENTCDNDVIIDSQGNIVTQNIDSNNDTTKFGTSSDVIGANLNEAFDNLRFLEMRQEALKNKHKVMSHEFGTDNENNKIKDQPPLIKLPSVDEENNVEDEWLPYAEARRNKMKVLGVEFGLVKEETKKNISEPRTEAQKEALINKQKILGVEYNLPAEIAVTREAANVAQEEAIVNKQKVLGVEYNLPAKIAVTREAANVAQEEAIINKQKVLGVEYNLPAEIAVTREAANVAQEEAIVNKQKVLGVEYNLPAKIAVTREAANVAQEEAIVNKQKVLGVEYNLPAKIAVTREAANVAQEEAIINKQKVLGVEYNLPAKIAVTREAANVAQEEALINKQKVLGVEYNLPAEIATKREAANVAQEEAIRNKTKILGSEYETGTKTVSKPSMARKSSLTLNLKPYGEASSNYAVTPSTGALTPGEFFSKLDLETPTTADMPADGAMTCDVFTPRSETSKDLESAKVMSDKNFLGSNGFNFPIVVDDDAAASEGLSEIQTEPSPQNSPSKTLDLCDAKDLCVRTSVFNILDGSYNLDNFDPFGVKDLQKFTKDFFSTRMDSSLSFYTHPAAIMEEVKKRPYNNIFTSHYDPEDEEEYKTGSDNIATLTACLQRSVMLPLTYQLEVVNNSILTYFLVNLDMYEHLRSLKDYFFLMDGEFSRSICHNLFTKLTKTLNPQELLNFATLHNILDKALGSSISHIHKFSENLSFTITDSPLSFQHSSPDVLQCLSLTYSVSWPLNIILSQEALLRYARVFQFLIKMRRIFWILSEDFESLKLAAKLSRPLLRSPHYISVQIYRHVMASLIRALDNYIVTTCILSSWTEFEKDLKKARTLDDLYECHVVYIKKVLFRCLLNNRSTPVMKLLNDIFTVILKFSRVLKSGEWQQKEPNSCFTHTSYVQLEELFHLFEKLAKYLHKVVTKLMECGYQRHLVELLTMVNLNGYYDHSKSKEDTNLEELFHLFEKLAKYLYKADGSAATSGNWWNCLKWSI